MVVYSAAIHYNSNFSCMAMAQPSPKAIIEAFATAVQDELAEGRSVELPGLGVLKVEHKPSSKTDAAQSNDAAWVPPQRTVVFVPKNSSAAD